MEQIFEYIGNGIPTCAEEAIKRLSDIRADYSCFDDERPKYNALSMGIEALKKSIPKPPKKDNEDNLLCPLCGADVDWHKYCEECGQAIEW